MFSIKAIFQAIANGFAFFTKVSKTPEQKEVQQARKERDETDRLIDEKIDAPPASPNPRQLRRN
jgi:hypothetical protein